MRFLSLPLLLAAQNPSVDRQRRQQNGDQPQGATSSVSSADLRPTVTLDGGLEPDRIPDDVAYLYFFMALSKDPSATLPLRSGAAPPMCSISSKLAAARSEKKIAH